MASILDVFCAIVGFIIALVSLVGCGGLLSPLSLIFSIGSLGWRWLRKFNGRHVHNLGQLLASYRGTLSRSEQLGDQGGAGARDSSRTAAPSQDEFLCFEFVTGTRSKSKIILRASGCENAQASILATHRIPAMASADVLADADALDLSNKGAESTTPQGSCVGR